MAGLTLIQRGKTSIDAHNLALGITADTTVRVMRAPVGTRYRMVTAGGNVDAVADSNGTATFTLPAQTITSLTGYSDNYITPIPGQAIGTTVVQPGNVFDYDPSTLGSGVVVVDVDSSYYYSTSQGGAPYSQICETANYIFYVWRAGGRNIYGEGPNYFYAKRWNKSTKVFDQGPTAIGTSPDGHENYALDIAPNGILRAIWGGDYAVTMQYMETTNPYDITAWTTPITFPNKPTFTNDGGVMVYDINSVTGVNRALFLNVGSDVWFVKWPNAFPTTGNVTWTKVVDSANADSGGSFANWGALCGGMASDPLNQNKLGFTVGGYTNPSGAFPGPTYDTNYQNLYMMQTPDEGATWQRADGTTITIPATFNSNGTMNGADPVKIGWQYASSCKIAYFQGQPAILDDADRHVAGSRQGLNRYVPGTGWVRNEIVGLETNGAGSYAGTGTYQSGWGITFSSTAAGDRLVIYGTYIVGADRTAKTPGTGPYLQRIQSTDGFATYNTDRPLDGGNYTDFQWAEYDLWHDNGAGSMGDYSYGAGWQYPKHAKNSPDHLMFASIDYRIGTVMAMNLPTPAPLVITPTAEWKQTGNALTVTLLSTAPNTVTAQVYSVYGGPVRLGGPDAAKFSLSLNGTSFSSSVTVPAGVTSIWIKASPGTLDNSLVAKVGVPT